MDGAKVERGFITCIFPALGGDGGGAWGGGAYKIKKDESKCTSFIRIYITAGSGFLCVWIDSVLQKPRIQMMDFKTEVWRMSKLVRGR